MISLICLLCVLSIMRTNGNPETNQLEKRVFELESTIEYLSNRLDNELLKVLNVSNQVKDKDFGAIR